MAEAFANCYGSDILFAESRGLAPVPKVPGNSVVAMHEKNIDISRHVSKRYDPSVAALADLVVNMSGYPLPGVQPKKVLVWQIADPYGQSLQAFQQTRDMLENQVMSLILDLRRQAKAQSA
jgi:protein-tyrosine-phosphatase